MAASPPVAPALSRTLRSRHVALISIGGIIGAGLFVGSSANIATVGPAVLVSYAVAGALMFLVMRMLAEMSAADGQAGSFADHARAGLGEWAGFVCGWLYWYFWVVVVGIEAIAGAVILQIWIALPVWQIGLVLMVLLTATNLLSTRSYGEFEFWFASIKVAAIVAFIVVAGGYALGLTSPTGHTLANLVAHGGFAPFGAAAVLAGVTGIVFSMTGAEIATVVAAESSEPSRAIANMTTSLILRILLFYVGSVLCILAVVPWPEIVPGSSPFVAALDRMDVPFAATIMNVIVLVAVLSCLNSGLYVTSRMLFGLAAHGDAPRALVALDSRGVPTRAILIGTAFGYLAVLASVVSPQRLFTFLVNASGAIMLVIYLLVALAQIKRRRVYERDGERLAIRMWLFPWLSYATAIGIALVLLSMLFRAAERAQLAASALSVGVVLAAFWWQRRRSR
ncbi:MAG TPA: amino acid permease [Gammaproteobacteria bacterium]|nr:amino acid permease [Gammaproteobacteria bacterium]